MTDNPTEEEDLTIQTLEEEEEDKITKIMMSQKDKKPQKSLTNL